MGAYDGLEPFTADGEDVHPDYVGEAIPQRPFEEQIKEYLIQAELQVRRNAKGTTKKRSARDLLKKCFRMVEQSARHLSVKERLTFLEDLVGLEMTLLTEGSNYLVLKTISQSPKPSLLLRSHPISG